MPIIFEEKKKRQQVFLGVFFVVLLIGGLFLYQKLINERGIGFSFERSIEEEEEIVRPPSLTLEKLLSIKLEGAAFNDPRLKTLETNGILPIQVRDEERGRQNPTLPFEL